MKFLFLAGHPALDFLNTAFTPPTGGASIEMIGDGESFVAWLVEAGLLNAASASKLKRRFGAIALDEIAAEARKFRQWTSGWLARFCQAPDAHYGPELQRLNRLLEQGSCYREVVAAEARWKMVEHCRIDAARALLALLASQVALLITVEEPQLVKRCAGADCVLWFVDRTKAHRRMFCSAAACGNRAKVAAFREREHAKGRTS
jgi:predicted RNA-binding Zn ribbon-like protein